MTVVSEVAFSQQQSLSVSRSLELEVSRSLEAQSRQAYLRQTGGGSPEEFQGIFDIIDISEEARSRLTQDRQLANALADYVRGRGQLGYRYEVPSRSLNVQLSAVQAESLERFSFTETYELSFLQESTLSIETDQGSIEVTQSRLVEVSLSASVELERSASVAFGSTAS